MYKLLKDFFKVILCGSGIGVFIIFLWTPIQFLINILIKLFVVLPMFLFLKFMEATGSKLKKLLVNTNNQIQNELKCKYISGTIILPFIIFWLYCSYALFKELPFSSSAILSNIVIFGSFPINWWIALFIALGLIGFALMSLEKELGFWNIIYAMFNAFALFDKSCMNSFVNTTIILFVFVCLYIYSLFGPLEFHSVIMEDLEADQTLTGQEKWSYYLNKRKKW